MDFYIKDTFKIIEQVPDPSPNKKNVNIIKRINFEIQNLDISIINGLRRIINAEVPCWSMNPDAAQSSGFNLYCLTQENFESAEECLEQWVNLPQDEKEKYTKKANNEVNNKTIFNTEFLYEDRLSLLPISSDAPELTDDGSLIFKICKLPEEGQPPNPSDWIQPLENPNNENLLIFAKDITVLKKIKDVEEATESEDLTPSKPIFTKGGIEIGATESTEMDLTYVPNAQLNESSSLVSPIDDLSQYEPINILDYIKYPDMLLLVLRKGESILVEDMRPQRGVGKSHARWISSLCNYRFKTKDEFDGIPFKGIMGDNKINQEQTYPRAGGQVEENGEWRFLTKNEIGDDQALLEQLIWGQLETPKVYNMTLEYNGHMNPWNSWLTSMDILEEKVKYFMDIARNITSSGEINKKVTVQIHPQDIEHLIVFSIKDEDHTLGNLVQCHFLYQLEKIILNSSLDDQEKESALRNSFSQYKIPHPLRNDLIISLKAPDNIWLKKPDSGAPDKSGASEKWGIDTDPEGKYNNIFHPTLQVLMYSLDRVLELINSLRQDSQDVYNL